MSVEQPADQLAVLSDFGVAASWNGKAVQGIFDDKFLLANEHSEIIESLEPQFLCRASDVAGVLDGELITISGYAYTIRRIEPDGTGMTHLILSK